MFDLTAYEADLDRRILDLEAQLARWRDNTAEMEAEAQEDARLDAEYQEMLEREADELADAIAAGDCDENGEPLGYDRYHGRL